MLGQSRSPFSPKYCLHQQPDAKGRAQRKHADKLNTLPALNNLRVWHFRDSLLEEIPKYLAISVDFYAMRLLSHFEPK